MVAPASRRARISAWAVGSEMRTGELKPRPMISPLNTTTAPTGTSSYAAASRASVNASRMNRSSDTGVNCQQALEYEGLGPERAEHRRAEARIAVERQHQLGHERRTARDAAMRRLIQLQVVSDQGIGKCDGLSKSQAHAFAGDGIDRTGGIADQYSAAPIDSLQAASGSNGAALFAHGDCSLKPPLQFGKARQGGIQPQVRIARDHCDADLVAGYRRDVHLAFIAPINFHEIGPGAYAIMPAEAITEGFARRCVQAGPLSDAGVLAIGPDDPMSADFLKTCHASAPKELHAQLLRAIDQKLVQANAPHGDTGLGWE